VVMPTVDPVPGMLLLVNPNVMLQMLPTLVVNGVTI